jgi:hypothetical protein
MIAIAMVSYTMIAIAMVSYTIWACSCHLVMTNETNTVDAIVAMVTSKQLPMLRFSIYCLEGWFPMTVFKLIFINLVRLFFWALKICKFQNLIFFSSWFSWWLLLGFQSSLLVWAHHLGEVVVINTSWLCH